MVSRLDRLFILLDTGSNESIRLAAAKQLGEVQRVQPNDLNYLLRRIKEYSSKPVWETRVAAGQATSSVLEQVDGWPPKELSGQDDKSVCQKRVAISKVIDEIIDINAIFDQFDLDDIISSCPALLSVDTIDSDDTDLVNPSTSRGAATTRGRPRKNSTKTTSTKKVHTEQLLRQRKLINKELGISMVDSLNLGVKSTDIVSNDDLQCHSSETSSKSTNNPSNQQEIYLKLKSGISNYDKLIQKLQAAGHISETKLISDDTNEELNPLLWPISDLTQEYILDLFNPAWEIRHGAAIALREIVRHQGKSAGKRLDLLQESNDKLNQLWLVDISLTSICILGLDKFGDFLFDQVVAPVRENAAQLLGCCVSVMLEPYAHRVVTILLKMLENPSWEVRHGGIIGLKYSLNAIDKTFSKRLLNECLDPIFQLLGDSVDDVSAEAAATLFPVKDLIIETKPEKTPGLIKFLWEHLADLDELTTSTSNIVLLLASLITSSSADLSHEELIRSIPKLWPLLGHSSTSVRISVLKALNTLLKTQQSTCLTWMPEDLITTALRLVYQRSILENMDEVRTHIEDIWSLLLKIDDDSTRASIDKFNLLRSSSKYLNYWLCLTMQPLSNPIDRGNPMWLNIRPDGTPSCDKPEGDIYIGSSTFNAETLVHQKSQVTRCRLLGAKLLGTLYSRLVYDKDGSPHSKDTLKYLSEMFTHYIRMKSAYQRIYSGWILESWAVQQIEQLSGDLEILKSLLPETLTGQLNTALQEVTLCYDELAPNFTRLQQEAREFASNLKDAAICPANLPVVADRRIIYNLNQIQMLSELDLEQELTRIASKRSTNDNKDNHDIKGSKVYLSLLTKKNNLTKTLKSTTQSQKSLSTSVLSSLACSQISWKLIPEKLSLIANPLLDSIETEEEQLLQDKSIVYLTVLVDLLCKNHEQNAVTINDILTRLMNLLANRELIVFNLESDMSSPSSTNEYNGLASRSESNRIILLDHLQRKAELNRQTSRRQSSVGLSSQSLKRSLSISSNTELDNEKFDTVSNGPSPRLDLASRGASQSLKSLVRHFGQDLPQKLPLFWHLISEDIESQIDVHLKVIGNGQAERNRDQETKFIKNLLLLETVGLDINANLQLYLLKLFDRLIELLPHPHSMIRHRISQCLGVISKLTFADTIGSISKSILPKLSLMDNLLARCGSIEAIASIIEHLQLELVPKIDIFVVHVLRRMSDQNDQVRLMATHCFGKLLSLMPLNLEGGTSRKPSTDLSIKLEKSQNTEPPRDEQKFIEQLLNPRKLENFELPFKMNAELRSYQQGGLNWLAFLNRFNLHGILCDEMGLGKTFMTICMVAADHFLANGHSDNKVKLEESPISEATYKCGPSLIVCPATLTEHWLYEIIKFIPSEMRSILHPVNYSGNQFDRANLRATILKDHSTLEKTSKKDVKINLIVSSYDIVRNDIDFFKSINWNYCVLDEGHIIKNGKTKLSKAIRLLSAKHRLILSGTPIQNNVTELWSLFDFLMPGFLGSERQFHNRYAKPILQSREPKCSARDLEAGALAMESLHRQVLPFILRRLKEDVLKDLPPKIIQDYYCELSPLQHKLYEDFTKSKLCKDVTKKSLGLLLDDSEQEDTKPNEQKENSKGHVFQALQYLKNVCNHPKLVLTQKHPHYSEITKSLNDEKSSLDDINHSSKLKALKQLLLDCGIGVSNQLPEEHQQQTSQTFPIESVVNQHRALIFCQFRSMVNIIEEDLLKKHLTSITYLKLDGSVPPNQRHLIVSRFNDDPSIDILLLTTQIGGLGLNLTGADTVIFVEHDWNPTKDLQAMDRAHRIGQRKVVNVYRLITKSTLEERIMGLQKFKTMVSNTVINSDNTGLGTMNVDQLFDLFDGTTNRETICDTTSGRKTKKGSFEDILPELWDQQQYETEYDLSGFVSSLKGLDA